MKGTEKQIKWAEDIINRMRALSANDIKLAIIDKVKTFADRAEAKAAMRLQMPMTDDVIMAEARAAEDALVAEHDAAAWWIDNRWDIKKAIAETFFRA